jgi:L-lactate dehydrogenase (cytochrome)
MARIISTQEISKHCLPEDLWIVVGDTVYEMTEFAPEHPGGAKSMLLYGFLRTLY